MTLASPRRWPARHSPPWHEASARGPGIPVRSEPGQEPSHATATKDGDGAREAPGPHAARERGEVTVTIIPIRGVGEVHAGDEIATLLADAATASGTPIEDGDCVVVTQKIVSKAEDRLVDLDPEDLDAKRRLVESESVRVLRRRGDLVISETRHGFVCANAGIDLSNVDAGRAALLPVDADRSARHIRDALRARHGIDAAIVVSDTFGRPWRLGLTDVAIGVCGLTAVLDLRGQHDANGRELQVTEIAVADEVASAAELVMGKAANVPAAIVRGLDAMFFGDGSARDLVRSPGEDLFR